VRSLSLRLPVRPWLGLAVVMLTGLAPGQDGSDDDARSVRGVRGRADTTRSWKIEHRTAEMFSNPFTSVDSPLWHPYSSGIAKVGLDGVSTKGLPP